MIVLGLSTATLLIEAFWELKKNTVESKLPGSIKSFNYTIVFVSN